MNTPPRPAAPADELVTFEVELGATSTYTDEARSARIAAEIKANRQAEVDYLRSGIGTCDVFAGWDLRSAS